VSEAILNLCDDRIFIEMNRFESLNVAVAAGICCYAFRKQDL
ncbi:MAG: RNA methyltransferase, partial [Dielma fastidiosa]